MRFSEKKQISNDAMFGWQLYNIFYQELPTSAVSCLSSHSQNVSFDIIKTTEKWFSIIIRNVKRSFRPDSIFPPPDTIEPIEPWSLDSRPLCFAWAHCFEFFQLNPVRWSWSWWQRPPLRSETWDSIIISLNSFWRFIIILKAIIQKIWRKQK